MWIFSDISELPQKPQVVFVEQPDVVDAVAQLYRTRSLTTLSKAVLQNCQTTCNQTNATVSESFQIAQSITARSIYRMVGGAWD
jgi:hypothetical protein